MSEQRTQALAAVVAEQQAALEALTEIVERQGRLIVQLIEAIGGLADIPVAMPRAVTGNSRQ